MFVLYSGVFGCYMTPRGKWNADPKNAFHFDDKVVASAVVATMDKNLRLEVVPLEEATIDWVPVGGGN